MSVIVGNLAALHLYIAVPPSNFNLGMINHVAPLTACSNKSSQTGRDTLDILVHFGNFAQR